MEWQECGSTVVATGSVTGGGVCLLQPQNLHHFEIQSSVTTIKVDWFRFLIGEIFDFFLLMASSIKDLVNIKVTRKGTGASDAKGASVPGSKGIWPSLHTPQPSGSL